MRRKLMHIVSLYLIVMCIFVIQNGKCEVYETKRYSKCNSKCME